MRSLVLLVSLLAACATRLPAGDCPLIPDGGAIGGGAIVNACSVPGESCSYEETIPGVPRVVHWSCGCYAPELRMKCCALADGISDACPSSALPVPDGQLCCNDCPAFRPGVGWVTCACVDHRYRCD